MQAAKSKVLVERRIPGNAAEGRQRYRVDATALRCSDRHGHEVAAKAESLTIEPYGELVYVQLGAVLIRAQESAQIAAAVLDDPAPAAFAALCSKCTCSCYIMPDRSLRRTGSDLH
ncbi:hypothetical protein GCM10009087_47900 [Sphingomonas oligophenolica]|uniref:Uncharacterized protein n=1 Tax=Sphingomonas oligophenolica TaxID=301154 RepID=A0ABU9Y768_9SPHN